MAITKEQYKAANARGAAAIARVYVPGLIEGAFGSGRWMQQIGKLGGSMRSAIKAKASRENGKRGGRPRDRVAA